MVKAPRSKGCRVCVERRVKCDQRRPYCLRCQKANRQCPGYETINFVDEGPSVRELYKNVGRGDVEKRVRSRASTDSSTSSRTRPENQAPFEYLQISSASRTGSASPFASTDGVAIDIERSTLLTILSPNNYQAQLLSSFINSITSTNAAQLTPTFHCHSMWMTDMANKAGVSPTLTWAIRAISMSHLGRQMQDKNLINNSRTMYGRALLKLNQALQDPVEGLSSDTLSATILLSFYELLTCTEQHSWVRHAGGAGNLMRIRGPHRHRSGFDSSVFLACRFTIIMEAFVTKKPCFLAKPEWKQLSRDLQSQADLQTPFHAAREEVFQTMVEFPGYIAESVDFMSSDARDTARLRDLVRQGHVHRSTYKRVQSRLIGTLREAGQEPTLTPSAYDDKLFPTVYQFPSNLVASYYCGHWATTAILNVVLIGLESKLSELSSPSPPPTSPPSATATPTSSLPTASTNPNIWRLTERTRHETSPLSPTSPPASSPSAFPTLSSSDTTSRRQMYLAENIHCAREICKSVENMSLTMFLGPMFLVFALRTALRVLGAKEGEWILGKLEEMGRVFGVARGEGNGKGV